MLILIFSLFFSAHAESLSPRQSLWDLNAAANVLRVAFDGDGAAACGIESSEAAKLMPGIESRVDKKKEELLKKPYGKGWPTHAQLKKCEVLCQCGILTDLLEAAGPLRKDWQDDFKEARKKAESQSAEESKKCSIKARWFCSSVLLKSLREEIKSSGDKAH